MMQRLKRPLRCPHRSSIALGAFLLCAAANSPAHGAFQLRSGHVGDVDVAGNVPFSLTFNQVPDFFTVDRYGRQAHSFQFYIGRSTNVPRFSTRPFASLIRGEEIRVANDIRIRNDSPGPSTDPDPNSGGWGSIRGSVPYTLDGQTMTFAVPATVLNVQGQFGYNFLLFEYGAYVSPQYPGLSGGAIPVVPEPSSAALAALAGVGMGWFGLTRRSGRRPSARAVMPRAGG